MYLKDGIPYPSIGTDIPAWFYSGLLSIDHNFEIFLHPYEIIYDDIVNEYVGSLDDPRFNIHFEGGYKIFGHPLKGRGESYKPDGRFHIWRHCFPHGWAHILPLESLEGPYLLLALERIWLQAWYRDKYGDLAWNKMTREEQEAIHRNIQKVQTEKFGEIQEQNSWLMNKAMENFASGRTKPTNPTKDIITSYSGQTNKSRIIRPITDREGGLIVPDDWE